jgi:hypothetical protein
VPGFAVLGGVRFEQESDRAREDLMVKAAMKDGGTTLVVLGGRHDLSESVRRAGGCEYIRVTTRRFQEFHAHN